MSGFFGIGIEHGKTLANLGTLWRSADLFGASFLFTIGRRYKPQASDTMKSWRNVPLYNYSSFADFAEHRPHDCRLVGVELTESASKIEEFIHPHRCVYLLGAEDHGLTKEAMAACQAIVRLPGRFSMNVASAGTVVLYDRHAKETYP